MKTYKAEASDQSFCSQKLLDQPLIVYEVCVFVYACDSLYHIHYVLAGHSRVSATCIVTSLSIRLEPVYKSLARNVMQKHYEWGFSLQRHNYACFVVGCQVQGI